MLFKTRGIVLNYIKYRETSIIAKLYTEDFGIQSYIINSIRSKTAKTKIALFQPLTLLDLVVYHKSSGALQRISEVKCSHPFSSIPFQIHKSSITIFLAEILTKTMKEESANKVLFEFLFNSILHFDHQETNLENFHLQFLVNLSQFLGFGPSTPNDLLNTRSIKSFNQEEKEFLLELISNQKNELVKANNLTRRNCLEYLITFYSFHVENFGQVNSMKILKEVLSA